MTLSLARAEEKKDTCIHGGSTIKIATNALSVGLLKTLHALKKVSPNWNDAVFLTVSG